MQLLTLLVGISLAGQVAGGDRYNQPTSNGAATNRTTSGDNSATRPAWPRQPAEPLTGSAARQPAARPAAERSGSSRAAQPSTPPAQTRTSRSTAAQPKPAELLQTLAKPPSNGRLVGSPMALADVLRGASSRDEQSLLIESYWNLSAAVTDYYLALRESNELQTLRAGVLHPNARWQKAADALQQRERLARRSALAAQQHLRRISGQAGDSQLPLPSDLPHCGTYDTRYDEIFRDRRSRSALALHELLPLRYQDLKTQARAVADSRAWIDTVSQQRNPQSDGTNLLLVHELLVLRRREFVAAVRDYNLQIGRYTGLAAPGNIGAERLVAMLIRNSARRSAQGTTHPRTGWNRSGIKRTSAVESYDPPRTYADDPPAESNSQTAGRERSIMVQRLPGSTPSGRN